MNPFTTLGVAPTADDRAIRDAYLVGIRASPPDTDPTRFRAISDAYELVKTAPARIRYQLFDETSPGDSPLDVVVRHAVGRGAPKPMNRDTQRAFLRDCLES